jgi:probable HAF family extracellular repeat protein
MRDLGIGAGLAYGINNEGEVVGEYNGQAFIYSLRRGKMQILGTLGGSQFVNYSYATCINNILRHQWAVLTTARRIASTTGAKWLAN